MMTIFFTPWTFIARIALATESAMKRGGDMVFANGESDARRALRATMMAEMLGVAAKALSISACCRQEPCMRVSPARCWTVDASRTSAVTVWPRDRAFLMTREPVRPLPPRIRKCMVWFGDESRV